MEPFESDNDSDLEFLDLPQHIDVERRRKVFRPRINMDMDDYKV